jgi:hypothetical protein
MFHKSRDRKHNSSYNQYNEMNKNKTMKNGSMSPIYIRSVIYLGKFAQLDDAFCIDTALAVVCPLEKYENLISSIFIPRKRELKTSPRSETNSLFLGNIFK